MGINNHSMLGCRGLIVAKLIFKSGFPGAFQAFTASVVIKWAATIKLHFAVKIVL